MNIEIKHLDHGLGLPLPTYGTQDSVGADVSAAIDQDLTLAPGERALVPTGFALALPKGYEAQLRPRSGLALKHGLTVLNAPATIDPDYRGEVKVILINHGQEPFVIQRGMRIAQMVIAPFIQVAWSQVEGSLDTTQRQEGGFGSTGTHAVSG